VDRILDDVKAVAICGKTIRQDCCTIALRFRLRFVATHGGIRHYILNRKLGDRLPRLVRRHIWTR